MKHTYPLNTNLSWTETSNVTYLSQDDLRHVLVSHYITCLT